MTSAPIMHTPSLRRTTEAQESQETISGMSATPLQREKGERLYVPEVRFQKIRGIRRGEGASMGFDIVAWRSIGENPLHVQCAKLGARKSTTNATVTNRVRAYASKRLIIYLVQS